MRHITASRLALTVLGMMAALLPAAGAASSPANDAGVPLWPVFYQSGDGRHGEAAACLYGWHGANRHLGPVFWGKDYFHVAPLVWTTSDGDWLLIPLAWDINGKKGVGPVWWGKDYFSVFPLFWQQGENWILPGAWSWNGDKGFLTLYWGDRHFAAFPLYFQNHERWSSLLIVGHHFSTGDGHVFPLFWWGRGHFSLFPLYWQFQSKEVPDKTNRLLIPLAWDWDGDRGVGPVWWGKDYTTVFPLLWTRKDNWLLLPLAWDWDGDRGVGPVWWKKNDYLYALPFYWQWKSPGTLAKTNRVLLPVAWDVDGYRGIGPVWWGQDFFNVFPLYWNRRDDWFLLPLAWNMEGNHGVGTVWWKDQGYFHVFPLFWSQANGDWIVFPLAWKVDGGKGVGPVWWGQDSFTVFPLLWTGKDNWLLFPLAWDRNGERGVGPVWWSDRHLTVFPFYWQWPGRPEAKDANHLLLPLAWDVDGHQGVGPVCWKNDDYLRIMPLFWKHRQDWTLLPLAWRREKADGVLPFYAAWEDAGAQRTVLPLLLGSSVKKGGTRTTHLLAYLFNLENDRDGYTFQFQPLLQLEGGKRTQFSLLWRFLQYTRDETGNSYWRFLFLPHKFGQRADAAVAAGPVPRPAAAR